MLSGSSFDMCLDSDSSTWSFDTEMANDLAACDPQYLANLEARCQSLMQEKFILAVEKQTVQAAYQELLQNIGNKLDAAAAQSVPPPQTSPIGSVHDHPPIIELSREKFPNAKYWEKDDWERPGGKPRRSAPKVSATDRPASKRSSEPKFATPYITDENGNLVNTAYMRQRLYAILQQLVLFGIAPRSFGTIGHEALEYVIAIMEYLFPFLRCCAGHWKVRAFATFYYPCWWSTHGPMPDDASAANGAGSGGPGSDGPGAGSKRAAAEGGERVAKRTRAFPSVAGGSSASPSPAPEPELPERPNVDDRSRAMVTPLSSGLDQVGHNASAEPHAPPTELAPSAVQGDRADTLQVFEYQYDNPLADIPRPSAPPQSNGDVAGQIRNTDNATTGLMIEADHHEEIPAAISPRVTSQSPPPSPPSQAAPSASSSSSTNSDTLSIPAQNPSRSPVTGSGILAPQSDAEGATPGDISTLTSVPIDGLPPWTGLPSDKVSSRKRIQVNKKSTTPRALCQAGFFKKYQGFTDEFKYYWDNIISKSPSLLQFWEARSMAASTALAIASS